MGSPKSYLAILKKASFPSSIGIRVNLANNYSLLAGFIGQASKKTKPILKRIKDGKKIAMKKKINIGFPILIQIYVFYLNGKF